MNETVRTVPSSQPGFEMSQNKVASSPDKSMQSRLQETVRAVTDRWPHRARTAIVLGSGLGDFAETLDIAAILPYRLLPHFPCSTAPGHAGRLICGELHGQPLLVLQGRCHLYEGYCVEEITFPVRLLHALGIDTLILSCAAGGLAPQLAVGDLLVIEDHLNLQFAQRGQSAFRRGQTSQFPYEKNFVKELMDVARRLGIPAARGTYIGVAGPNYETRAEQRFLRQLGTAVGMSTVAEASLASQLGLRVCGLAAITNLCNPDQPEQTDGDHVVQAAARAEPRFRRLLVEFLKRLARTRQQNGDLTTGLDCARSTGVLSRLDENLLSH